MSETIASEPTAQEAAELYAAIDQALGSGTRLDLDLEPGLALGPAPAGRGDKSPG